LLNITSPTRCEKLKCTPPYRLPVDECHFSPNFILMPNQVKKAIQKIEELPQAQQEEIAKLILEELSWDQTFEVTQEQLSSLAREATKEYTSGKTSSKDW